MRQRVSLVLSLAFFLLSCGQSQNKSQASTTNNTSNTEATASNGKQLFINYCQQCHALNTDKNGPKLAGALARWNNNEKDLEAFIQNSQHVIQEGNNTYATNLYNKWGQSMMPAFPNLSDADLHALVTYINNGTE